MSDEALTVAPAAQNPEQLGMLSQDQADSMYASIMENVDQQAEVSISRLQIVQPGTPEVTNSKGYVAGQIMDARGKAIRSFLLPQPWLEGKVPVDEREKVWCMPFLNIGKLPTEFAEWTPEEQRKLDPTLPRIKWKTLDKKDPRVHEGTTVKRGGTWWHPSRPDTMGKRPPVTDAINYMLVPLTPDYQMQCSFRIGTFARTSAPAGVALTTSMSELSFLKKVPWFQVYWLYTKKVPDPKHNSTYFVYCLADGVPLAKANPSLFGICDELYRGAFTGPKAKEIQMNFLNMTFDEQDDTDPGELDANTVNAGTPETKTAPTGGADPF